MVGILTQPQSDILLGLLLGDGSLEFDGHRSTRLQVKQSANKKEYVMWLYSWFMEFVRTPPQQRKDTQQWYFATRSLPEFTTIHSMFYHQRRKIVPKTIQSFLLNPLTLAVWYMDDGSLDYREKYHYSFSLSTDSFTLTEVHLLQHVLRQRFGLYASVQYPSSRGTRYPKLYFGAESRDRFLELVQPYIMSCFQYKLPPCEYHNLTPQRLNPLRVR